MRVGRDANSIGACSDIYRDVHIARKLRPVKPCPGVPGIHLNADRTVSMTAALLCGAGASAVHKDRGCSADRDQIEDHAHAQRHAWRCCYG